jgi:teichuronic acid biosynthesis protein TuaE
MFIQLGIIWMIWGLVSILWSPNIIEGVKELFSILLGFLLVLSLLGLEGPRMEGLNALRLGWVWAAVVTGLIAGWELLTFNHLPNGGIEGEALDYLAATGHCLSTFGNPNNYGAFIIMASSFVFWLYLDAKKILTKIVIIIIIIMILIFLIFTSSRLAVLGELVSLGFLVLLRNKGHRSILYLGLFFIIILAVILSLSGTDVFIVEKFLRLGEEVGLDGTSPSRLLLIVDGIWMGLHSWGLGVGAGAFPYYVSQRLVPFPVGAHSPHNFWTEIFSQYGLVVSVLLLGWVLRFGALAWRSRKTAIHLNDPSMKLTSDIALTSLIGYWFASSCNSAFIGQPCNWMLLATWVMMGSWLEAHTKGQVKVAASNTSGDAR